MSFITYQELKIAFLSSLLTTVAYLTIVGLISLLWLIVLSVTAMGSTSVDFDRLLHCVAIVETGHIPEPQRDTVVSKCGAIGKYQIMPLHAKGHGYKVKDLYKPHVNKSIARKLLVGFYRKYGNLSQTLACYNGGPRQARIINNNNRCQETRYYVRAVLRLYKGG